MYFTKPSIKEIQPQHLNVMFSPVYAVPVFGFVVPPLAVIVLMVNAIMIWTLCMRHMRSPVNMFMICIAISDTLTIMMPVIPFVYFYTLGFYKDFVPFAWCRAFFNLVHVFPLLCNMASLWTTVALAVMRCYSVWRPLQAKSTITPFRTYISIGIIYVFSFAVYVPVIFEYTYVPLSSRSMMNPNSTIMSCHMEKSEAHISVNFCAAHTWLQIVCTSLLPWFLIAFPNGGLLWKLKKADDDRKTMNEDNELDRCVFLKSKMVSRKRMTTWMIFIVVSMVWIVEIPFAVSFTRYLAHSNGDLVNNNLGNSVIFVFVLKYITYPVIFVIYCFMSQKFRKTFQDSFGCGMKRKCSSLPSKGTTTSTSIQKTDKSLNEEKLLVSTNI